MQRTRRTAAQLLAVTGLAIIAKSTEAFTANSNVSLTVDSNVCSAFEFADLPEKYHFDVRLSALTLGSCAASTVT